MRGSESIRNLVRETRLAPSQFILPLFVCSGEGIRREIGSMPGNFQLSIDELVRAANASPSLEATAHDFSSLFPCVLAAAEAGDVSARSILTQAGAELAGLAKIVVRRHFPDAATVPVAMSGGVFRQSALVREVFYNSLRSLRSACPATTVNSSVIEPVRGALELARKAAAKGTAR